MMGLVIYMCISPYPLQLQAVHAVTGSWQHHITITASTKPAPALSETRLQPLSSGMRTGFITNNNPANAVAKAHVAPVSVVVAAAFTGQHCLPPPLPPPHKHHRLEQTLHIPHSCHHPLMLPPPTAAAAAPGPAVPWPRRYANFLPRPLPPASVRLVIVPVAANCPKLASTISAMARELLALLPPGYKVRAGWVGG